MYACIMYVHVPRTSKRFQHKLELCAGEYDFGLLFSVHSKQTYRQEDLS